MNERGEEKQGVVAGTKPTDKRAREEIKLGGIRETYRVRRIRGKREQKTKR